LKSGGMSSGAKTGIGVAISLSVILFLLVGHCVLRGGLSGKALTIDAEPNGEVIARGKARARRLSWACLQQHSISQART